MARNIDTALTQFCIYLKRTKKSSDLTITHYREYLRRFFESQKILTASNITSRKVELFQKELKAAGLQSTTQNYYLIALRGFIRWLPNDERRLSYRSIALTPIQYRSPASLPKHSINALLKEQLSAMNANPLSLRDRAILELLWSTGLKLYELPRLTIEGFDLKRKQLSIAGSHPRTIKLTTHAHYYLSEYLKLRQDQNPYLFISHDRAGTQRGAGTSMSTRSIQRLITKHSRRAGQGRSVTARTIQRARAAEPLS